jgi:hypothetical protein
MLNATLDVFEIEIGVESATRLAMAWTIAGFVKRVPSQVESG